LVADVFSAKKGFPNMGISACFGGPLFSKFRKSIQSNQNLSKTKPNFFETQDILLGVGIPFTYQCITTGNDIAVISFNCSNC